MNDMIKYQMNQLSEVVCPRITYMKDALSCNEGVVEWTDAETALQGGLYHLRHLSQSWQINLSHEVYCRTMGNLVDTLFSFYLDEVKKAKDISEPACQFVSSLFRDAIRGTAEFFVIKEGYDESLKEAERHCSLWNKFNAIGTFMNMSIADINVNLSVGTFREVTGPELSRLVIAVYQDSEKRQKLLALLANH
jgi:centromere/kinetochore protein ZW10